MSIFTGAGVAIVTPMKANGEVNYPKLEELLNYQIENGTDAIIICGTTGESSTLTHEEHLEAIRFTIEKVAGRIPVIAGTGSNCTQTAIYLSQEAEKYGADGLLLVSPYYNKATQKGLIAHFTAVANSVTSERGKQQVERFLRSPKGHSAVVTVVIFIPEMMTRSFRFCLLAEKV